MAKETGKRKKRPAAEAEESLLARTGRLFHSLSRQAVRALPLLLLFGACGWGLATLWTRAESSGDFRLGGAFDADSPALAALPPDARFDLLRRAEELLGRTSLEPGVPGALGRSLASSPWIASYEPVERRFPGRLVLRVEPNPPVAILCADNRYWRVDRAGRLLPTPEVAQLGGAPELPVIRAAFASGAAPAPGETHVEVVHALGVLDTIRRSALAARLPVSQLAVARRTYLDSTLRPRVSPPLVDLYTATGACIRWGAYESGDESAEPAAGEKIEMLRRILERTGELKSGDTVDVRTRSGYFASGSASR